MTATDKIEHICPGEVLMQDFIEGFGITQNKQAVPLGVSLRKIQEIALGKRGITAETAIRLARYCGTSEEFWMKLQSNYELRLERREFGNTVAKITRLRVTRAIQTLRIRALKLPAECRLVLLLDLDELRPTDS